MSMATESHTRLVHAASGSGWLARRWYYTPKSRRAYSVRQISPGDRRLLAEFALQLEQSADERGSATIRSLCDMVFDRVLAGGADMAVGFAALENAGAGDRVIGIAAYAPASRDEAAFTVAVAATHRHEQVGHTLLSTLVRQARRVGIRRITGEMQWSNRPMHLLAKSLGFEIEPVEGDRSLRRLALGLG